MENVYNKDGYKVEKTVDDDITRYLYKGDKVTLEVDDTNVEKASNVYGLNLLKRTVDNDCVKESYYYMKNGHADVDNNITYGGYQYDEETDLYYLDTRRYDAGIARFLLD